MSGHDTEEDPRRLAAELLGKVLDALPVGGARDVALRVAVEQRAAALNDLVNFDDVRGAGQ